MFGLVLALAVAQSPNGARQPGARPVSPAELEFAPLNGKGMTLPCACLTPTGARGEVVTWTRTGAAACSKTLAGPWIPGGMTEIGISDNSMVDCPTDTVRVEWDANGQAGVIAERGTHTNLLLRSSNFAHADWDRSAVGATPGPVVWTADAGSPWAGATADAVQFAATNPTTEASRAFQTVLTVGSAYVCSLYARGARPNDGGVAQSGAIDMVVDYGGGFDCYQCNYVADSWIRCKTRRRTVVTATGSFIIGNDSRTTTCSNAARTRQDVLLTRAQCEIDQMSSAIETAGAAVARGADLGFVTASPTSIDAGFSFAASLTASGPTISGLSLGPASFGSDDYSSVGCRSTTPTGANCRWASDAGPLTMGVTTGAPTTDAGVTLRVQMTAQWINGSTIRLWPTWQQSTPVPQSLVSNIWSWSRLEFRGAFGGVTTANSEPDGVVSRVCYSPTWGKCSNQ